MWTQTLCAISNGRLQNEAMEEKTLKNRKENYNFITLESFEDKSMAIKKFDFVTFVNESHSLDAQSPSEEVWNPDFRRIRL